jgi:hypothetical protein
MLTLASEVPWSIDSPQQRGRKAERNAARRKGARLHSNSGAGPEKNDYSTGGAVYEHKATAKTHTIKGSDLEALFRNAVRQGKEGRYVIYFSEANVTLEGVIYRGETRSET